MSKSVISVCALMLDPFDKMPGQRFRIEQWEPHLKSKNIKIDYFSFTDEKLRNVIYQDGNTVSKINLLLQAFFRRSKQVLSASKYDVVFLYRAASMFGPAILERFLHFRGLPIIYDFDDAIFLTNTSEANKLFGWAKFAGKTKTISRLSTSVTVGNNFLANFARRYNDNVYVIPSSIDVDRYKPADKIIDSNKPVIIGWTGSSTSQYYLEAFEPVLAEVIKLRNVEIRVISNRRPAFCQVPFVWREWSVHTEVEETAQFDIGIMPLPDDEWARGKCAMKALIYMSLGIPPVCSNVGTNSEVIEHNSNGFLANNENEWLIFLTELIDNSQLRKRLGNRARETVKKKYSSKVCAEEFARVVFETVRNSRV